MWLVANELEDPFGDDHNDLPVLQYHEYFCGAVRSLLRWTGRDTWSNASGPWQQSEDASTGREPPRGSNNVAFSEGEGHIAVAITPHGLDGSPADSDHPGDVASAQAQQRSSPVVSALPSNEVPTSSTTPSAHAGIGTPPSWFRILNPGQPTA